MEGNTLKGRTVIAVPRRNGKKFMAQHEGVILVDEAGIKERKTRIKAANKTRTGRAKK